MPGVRRSRMHTAAATPAPTAPKAAAKMNSARPIAERVPTRSGSAFMTKTPSPAPSVAAAGTVAFGTRAAMASNDGPTRRLAGIATTPANNQMAGTANKMSEGSLQKPRSLGGAVSVVAKNSRGATNAEAAPPTTEAFARNDHVSRGFAFIGGEGLVMRPNVRANRPA